MPTFDFTAPDGKSYSVEGPEGATAAQAFEILQTQIGSTTPPAGSSVGGVAKSLGVGLAEGAVGLAGLLGDVSVIGIPNNPESPYGSAAIKRAIERSTGEFYKPQGVAEETASKIGQFAPAVIGGPGSMAAKVATRVVAPAIASEGAGLLAGDGAAKPYAELAGALAGGVGGSLAAQRFNAAATARRGASTQPSAENLLKTAGGQFDEARDLNVVMKPSFATSTADDMRASVKNYDPEVAAKPILAAADRLEGLATSGRGLPPVAVQMNELEHIRKQLVSLKTSPDASVRDAAREAIKSMQRSQIAITPADVLAGDAAKFTSLSKDAIANWAAGKRSNTVMGKVALGDLNAATAGSGANEDNALRQAIKQLVRPVNNDIVPKASRLGFNQPEIDAMNKVARGTAGGNAARYLGKLAPTGSVSGVLSGGAGFAAAGPMGAIGLPAAGYVAKKIGDLSTKRAVAALDSLVRSRSPLAQQVAAQLPPQIVQQLPKKSQSLLQSLILANPTLANQPRQPVGQPAAQ